MASLAIGKQVDPHWHWEEKNILAWCRNRMATNIDSIRNLISNDEFVVAIRSVRVDGEATLNKRKGKLFLIYDLEVNVKWVGTVRVGEQVVGGTDGRIKMVHITNITSNKDQDVQESANPQLEPPVVECSCEYDNSQMKRPPEGLETKIKAEVEGAAGQIAKAVELLQLQLQETYTQAVESGEPSVFDVLLASTGEPLGETVQDESHADTAAKYVRDLKRKTMKKKFVHALSYFKGEDDTSTDSTEEVIQEGKLLLTFQSMDDNDMLELLDAITSAKSNGINEIRLSNNVIGNAGIQTLVTRLVSGGFPNLKTLKVDGNQFTEMGKTMLKGLRMLRKDIVVIAELDEFREIALS